MASGSVMLAHRVRLDSSESRRSRRSGDPGVGEAADRAGGSGVGGSSDRIGVPPHIRTAGPGGGAARVAAEAPAGPRVTTTRPRASPAATYAAGTSVHRRAGALKPSPRDVDLVTESPFGCAADSGSRPPPRPGAQCTREAGRQEGVSNLPTHVRPNHISRDHPHAVRRGRGDAGTCVGHRRAPSPQASPAGSCLGMHRRCRQARGRKPEPRASSGALRTRSRAGDPRRAATRGERQALAGGRASRCRHGSTPVLRPRVPRRTRCGRPADARGVHIHGLVDGRREPRLGNGGIRFATTDDHCLDAQSSTSKQHPRPQIPRAWHRGGARRADRSRRHRSDVRHGFRGPAVAVRAPERFWPWGPP
jgi:hypothetical protein